MAILRPFASTPSSGTSPESEERFRATLEQAAIGVGHQTLDDKWVWMNQRWCEIVGFSKEELLTRNLSGLTHPNDREASAEFDRKVRSGQLDRYSIEKRYIRKDGVRSEERRVGKECRSRWSTHQYNKQSRDR